jgi:hypothetical protein
VQKNIIVAVLPCEAELLILSNRLPPGTALYLRLIHPSTEFGVWSLWFCELVVSSYIFFGEVNFAD